MIDLTDANAADLVSAERERCAKIVEEWLTAFGNVNPEYVSARKWATDAVKDIADLIRNPQDS